MKGSVLLVEDDTHVRHIYAYLLTQHGYTVIEAGSIATARMHLDVVDLAAVVLDLRLPNGHGRRVVDELIAKRNDVPVVIMSGTPEEHEWDWPVIATLRKPVQRTPFLSAVNRAAFLSGEGIGKLRETTRRLKDLEPKKG